MVCPLPPANAIGNYSLFVTIDKYGKRFKKKTRIVTVPKLTSTKPIVGFIRLINCKILNRNVLKQAIKLLTQIINCLKQLVYFKYVILIKAISLHGSPLNATHFKYISLIPKYFNGTIFIIFLTALEVLFYCRSRPSKEYKTLHCKWVRVRVR